MKSICRDCGRRGDEDPDDPAPNLCPACYRQRLERITPLFEQRMNALVDEPGFDGNITPVIMWFAEALETIAGEKREYARAHANYMGHMIAMTNNGQLN